MKSVELDGREAVSCGAFHSLLAAALDLPGYYGGNLDALYDCLTALPEPTELVIRNFRVLEQRLGADYSGRIRRVLTDAQAEGRFAFRLL